MTGELYSGQFRWLQNAKEAGKKIGQVHNLVAITSNQIGNLPGAGTGRFVLQKGDFDVRIPIRRWK